jgi:hypothetical protein
MSESSTWSDLQRALSTSTRITARALKLVRAAVLSRMSTARLTASRSRFTGSLPVHSCQRGSCHLQPFSYSGAAVDSSSFTTPRFPQAVRSARPVLGCFSSPGVRAPCGSGNSRGSDPAGTFGGWSTWRMAGAVPPGPQFGTGTRFVLLRSLVHLYMRSAQRGWARPSAEFPWPSEYPPPRCQ